MYLCEKKMGKIIIISIILVLVIAFSYIAIKHYIGKYKQKIFNKRFDWILEHKNELPFSEEEKAYITDWNRKFIAIDDDYYKELRQYYKDKVKRDKKHKD